MKSSLTVDESRTLGFMISFLRSRGCNSLADRVERVFNNAKLGLITRPQLLTGVVREAAFRAVVLSCREKNGVYVIEFSKFLVA